MKKFLVLLIFMIIFVFAVNTYAADTQEVSTIDQVKQGFQRQMVKVVAYFILGIIGTLVASLFGYLAVKFPKLANWFYDIRSIISNEVEITEQKRKELFPGKLTAKQGIMLKSETTSKVMNTKVAQELRRGVANVFGIFGGKSKEFGKSLFDNMIPGLIDQQV